jgi:hypothetical protein
MGNLFPREHQLGRVAVERYFVVGLDDAGCAVFMTHQWFDTWEAAEAHAKGVAHSRMPVIVQAIKEFRPAGRKTN